MTLPVLLPLLLALLAAPIALLAGAFEARSAAPAGAAFALLALGAPLWGWLSGGGVVDVAWAPSWDLRLHLELDGLAALYALLATGIGFLVLVYSSPYLPLHLEHEERPASEGVGFYFFILLFMGSMVGLAMAQDLILIFVFWDLTAIASYYLIGFDRHDADSRASALMALLVTGVTAVLLLIGALLLYAAHGTFSVPELAGRVGPGPLLNTAGGLIAVAGLAKSAQVPLHFWLPRAMAAATPVSADLPPAARGGAGRRRRARGRGPAAAGARALLGAAGDGGAHPGLSVPALGGDGGRGRSPHRARLPPPPEERVPARRPPRRRHPLDGGRGRAGPDAGRLEATARLLDHRPVRARGDDVRPRGSLRRWRGGVLRDRARHRQERPVPDGRHGHGGDGGEPPEPARGFAKAQAAAAGGGGAGGGDPPAP